MEIIDLIKENLLGAFAFGLMAILMFYYLLEKYSGLKLSLKYRNSIFAAQGQRFLNASNFLISGDKDSAIKEFSSAMELNRDTIDIHFVLGKLLRSSGEIERAISLHRSLIARENISEETRFRALKELAIDFDKGGFIDKAIDTYKDVLKINRDQYEVIQALCRIYEDIQDWDQAYNYRIMMNKMGPENHSETISHILVQKAKALFKQGEFDRCHEDLEDAFRFAPSVSAKILRLGLFLSRGEMEKAKELFLEIIKEMPQYTSFAFESLHEGFVGDDTSQKNYQKQVKDLEKFFLELDDSEVFLSPSAVLAKVRILKDRGQLERAGQTMMELIGHHPFLAQTLKIEYVKILIELGKKERAIKETGELLKNIKKSETKHYCRHCGHDSDEIFWRCPQCHSWETIQFRWKI